MDGYVPPHCACCVHRPSVERGTGRLRARGVYLLPIAVLVDEEDDYETKQFYHHHHHHHQGLPARRRRWLRQMEEEEAFEAPPAHFAFFEHRRKRVDACKICLSNNTGEKEEKGQQQDFLHTLARRLEALEVGMEDLTRVRNSPAPPQKTQRRRGCRHVTRSNPAVDDFATLRAESFQSGLSEKKTGRKVMDPVEAAVIIQTRFRAYLVRRSQSLRNLRDLAVLKSSLRELKCFFVEARYRRLVSRDPDERKRFSERATALLLKVDSIQGSELMVREARRSLSKELVALLDSLDHMGSYPSGNSKPSGHRKPAQHTEDTMAMERVRMSSDCFHCSGEMQMAHSSTVQEELMTEEEEEEEEEEVEAEVIKGPGDWRGRISHRGYFTCATLEPVFNSNEHKHSHGSQQCKSNEFDMARYTNKKTRRNGRKKEYIGRGEMAAMEEMTDIGYGCYSFPF